MAAPVFVEQERGRVQESAGRTIDPLSPGRDDLRRGTVLRHPDEKIVTECFDVGAECLRQQEFRLGTADFTTIPPTTRALGAMLRAPWAPAALVWRGDGAVLAVLLVSKEMADGERRSGGLLFLGVDGANELSVNVALPPLIDPRRTALYWDDLRTIHVVSGGVDAAQAKLKREEGAEVTLESLDVASAAAGEIFGRWRGRWLTMDRGAWWWGDHLLRADAADIPVVQAGAQWLALSDRGASGVRIWCAADSADGMPLKESHVPGIELPRSDGPRGASTAQRHVVARRADMHDLVVIEACTGRPISIHPQPIRGVNVP